LTREKKGDPQSTVVIGNALDQTFGGPPSQIRIQRIRGLLLRLCS
jgi:hypothetical protein